MNERALDTLELKPFLALAARHVQTASGSLHMQKMHPSVSPSDIMRDLDITSECVEFLSASGKFGLAGIDDPAPTLEILRVEGTALEPKQILKLEKLLSSSQQLKSSIKNAQPAESFPILRQIASAIPDTRRLLSTIGGKILPSGELDDNASTGLRLVRKELADRRTRIHRTLESIIRSKTQAVQEEIITFRNDRFVIPVRTDSRNQIPGVVHGLSSSGQTTFVEPLMIIEQNNDLVRLHEEESLEISRILLELTDSLRDNLEDIRTVVENLTILDVSQAKALLASEFQCVRPEISDRKELEICNARYILLEHSLRSTGAKPVPISLELDPEHQVLVISGPNAGGKTVTLKTLGLISLMAQMGFHVPAQKARLPVFNQIFADIGDQQSMTANLSTFTAHMRNIVEMDSQMDTPSLVLLDEVGTGTDPEEGAALAIAIVEYFMQIGATTIVSTHYPRLKMWASQTGGVRNASVEFDEKTLRPTYRLTLGVAGSSSGIEIARRINITEAILSRAQSLIEPSYAQAREYLRQLKEKLDEQEMVQAALDSERAAVSKKYSELEKEFAHREKKRKEEFDSRLERVMRDFESESDRALRQIRDRIEARRIKKAVEGQSALLRRKAVQLSGNNPLSGTDHEVHTPKQDEEIHKGDPVRILSLDREGSVESVSDEVCIISIGAIRYRAERSDLVKIHSLPDTAPVSGSRQSTFVDAADAEAVSELKVIGMTADEAISRVDKFLDSSFLAGVEKIRIIHGHGKGILRQAIADLLEDHIQVERFSTATPEQGGSGVTIVELKK
jgi:DNA mismatch repair protein MutS2